MHRILRAAAALALLAAIPSPARAEISDGVVRVGVLNDLSGVFQDYNGPGSVTAARMAAEDFMASDRGRPFRVEVVQADHQNRADVGSALVRRWLDVDRVDAVVDVPNSAVGLAVNGLLRGSRATFLASSTASSDLTGAQCSPNTVQWVTDTWAIGRGTARAAMEAGGARSWYFLTVDYALGQAIERDATAAITAAGGRVVGATRHPLGNADFSSALLQARSSGAEAVGLANAGVDTANSLKQAAEFGMGRDGKQRPVAFLAFIQDVHAIGLEAAQGLRLVEAFYWDMDENTRAFARRFAARMGGRVPSTNQAGVYSATLAYLDAVAATNSDDAREVVPAMKRRGAFRDPLFGDTSVRADGRTLHAMHLFEVKPPAESRAPYDYYRLVRSIPAEEAFRPLAEGGCPMAAQ